MLNEPEYEEQPSTRTHSPYGNFGNTTRIVEKEAETSDNTKTAQAFEALDRNLVHSTPIRYIVIAFLNVVFKYNLKLTECL